jgi:DNA ligase-4
MNKGVYDIIRPRWLLDSIANNELVPMSKKYFFHAAAERLNSEDYDDKDDEDDDGLERRSPEESALRKSSASPGTHVDAEMSEPKEDSDMQDWLQVEPGSNVAENLRDDAESVTDPDSDNEDNWFSVEAPQLGGAPASETEVSF